MTKIRAKMKVVHVDYKIKGQQTVTFLCVTEGSEENKEFSKYTPSGKLELVISDETKAYDSLEIANTYYVDISRTEDPPFRYE